MTEGGLARETDGEVVGSTADPIVESVGLPQGEPWTRLEWNKI